MAATTTATPIRLVRGSDDVLLNEAVVELVANLVGDGDRSLLVDEFTGADYELAAVVDAAQTMPFLTDRRIVVARNVGRFSKADDVAPLVAYLADPLASSELVVVWETPPGERLSAVPKKLADALKAAGGEVVATDAGTGKARADWWSEHLKGAPVTLDARAGALVKEQLADDVSEWSALVARLVAVYGEGSKLGVDEVEPYLGRAGSVPPWDLTDAIDAGARPRRSTCSTACSMRGDRHPLQIMATLQGHYVRMLRLDGSGARNERDAADRLGMKGSTFPAKKALGQARSARPRRRDPGRHPARRSRPDAPRWRRGLARRPGRSRCWWPASAASEAARGAPRLSANAG